MVLPQVTIMRSPCERERVFSATRFASEISSSVEVKTPHIAGMIPHERESLRQVEEVVVSPIISTGERNLETIRAVMPERVDATITFAPISIAIPQVAWESASGTFLILNSERLKREV